MLAGPMDYTPGAFGNSNRENFVARNFMPMGLGTRARRSWLFTSSSRARCEMVSDYPEHYAGQKEFDFIKQVPATWDEVRAIGGTPMEWISLARRSGKDWYVGSLTNWDARDVKMPLSFLGEGKYVAEIYADAPDAAVEATHTRCRRSPWTGPQCWTSTWFPAAGTRSGFIRRETMRLRRAVRLTGVDDGACKNLVSNGKLESLNPGMI